MTMRLIRIAARVLVFTLLGMSVVLAQGDEGILIPPDTTAWIAFQTDPPTLYRIRQYPDAPTIVTLRAVQIDFSAVLRDAGGETLATFGEGIAVIMLDLGSGDAVFTLEIKAAGAVGSPLQGVLARVGTDFDAPPPERADSVVLPPATAAPTNTPSNTPSNTPTFTPSRTPTFTPSRTPTPEDESTAEVLSTVTPRLRMTATATRTTP